MKTKIALAVLMGLLAMSALVPLALAQCSPGVMIEFDADCFAYESNYNSATYISSPGSQLNVVGIISAWCAPFGDLNANNPNKEYTFLLTGLSSAGTQLFGPFGGVTFYETDYAGGTFAIYEGSPRNAPTAAGGMPANPPNATVPLNFVDGTLILNGALANFHTSITTGGGPTNGSFRSDYGFTGPVGGTYFSRVDGSGLGLLHGNWCVLAGCVPTGYSAHPNGKFDVPATETRSSTWGAIKQLYR